MVSRNKKKTLARKRKLEEEPEDVKTIEIDTPKKKSSTDAVKECEDSNFIAVKEDSGSDLTILPTRHSLAEQLIIGIRQKQFAIIEGPIGCGKTFMAKYASGQLELPLKSMQMGDQVDSKSIFGSYNCTEVAGQFRWKSSSFSHWLTEPCVILLEDVDMANPDVISIFVEISANRSVTLPSGETLSFHENARLICTSSGRGKKNSVLDGVPVRIVLEPLTDMDLRRLITKTFPRSAHLAKTLTGIFRDVEAVPAAPNSRPLTSTDLLRGCSRINRLTDLATNSAIFTELVDSWCLSDQPTRSRILCDKIAAALTITADQVTFHISMRQPSFSYDDTICSVGRCRLPRNPSLKIAQKHRLGHTRDVLQLMERIAVCVQINEPVLLVGETGVGKTSVVQTLASTLNVHLKVVNLSPTSDSDELIEGYKPTTIAHILEPFTKFYYDVFTSNFDAKKNQKFLGHIETCLSSGRYRDYLTVVESTAQKALAANVDNKDPRWAEVVVRSRRIREGLDKRAAPFALTRGAVLEAAQEGYWLLIDEINLAPPECLDAIVHAISTAAHPNFRLFACMNPATDAGKRRLPAGVRTKFTEFYVAEMTDPFQLSMVVSAYLPSLKIASVENLVEFYLNSKSQFPGSYSLRTLCRALLFAADNMFGSPERSLYEAVCMAFLTNLDVDDKSKMRLKIQQTFRFDSKQMLLPKPGGANDNYIQVAGYWIEQGSNLPREDTKYVITKTVNENLAEIARIVCSGRFPILLEGETSAGKTSIVCHLARITGNDIIRINNHEHTDVQEYMGSYVADEGGRLVFREGALVNAVRNGSWVILDELNLAPTDVIEALNRLLDDNRELFVPELNQTISAHKRFRLFATQNPAGTYAGRKRLSRALLSRFVVLKFHHLPMDELSAMVCARCGVPPSAANKMIDVLSELRSKRSLSGLFSARDGLMTLRDVFRWAKRMSTDETCDDWLQILVNHGYFLLAGRCRNKKDEDAVVESLERVLKRKVETEKLFAADSPYFPKDVDVSKVVLTTGMRKMLVSTEQAWLRDEAVLMVGETGGGKTSLAETVGRGRLLTINCHERTETADLLGRLRPKEGGGFEWSDGIVISAMRSGAPLLVDEISLAEDSVLERLNPLFEEDRCLLLSDAGVEVHAVVASKGYQMIATMNPGGDYGKKELSKALRNRFTEIWSSCDYIGEELLLIFDSRLQRHTATSDMKHPSTAARAVVSWISKFFDKYSYVFRHAPSVRDIVACADLFAAAVGSSLTIPSAISESLSAVFLDSLASLPTRTIIDIETVKNEASNLLHQLLNTSAELKSNNTMAVDVGKDKLTIGQLSVVYGHLQPIRPKAFSLNAPTCVLNFYRIARGLLINKPILLEGGPGCGKSSTVMALAQLTGHPITRLNLSDQTDLSDLFGSDVPVIMDDGSISFKWEDGPVLRAIKTGEWVLLDEMNLASQSVLEGLNACFDHRRVLFIAELNKSFEIPADSQCRFFACQNPRAQGGNRRALPKSFVNRFTNIWVDDLTTKDISLILTEVVSAHGLDLSLEQLTSMIEINGRLADDLHLRGGPFSFNLRDLLRWCQLISKTQDISAAFELLYVSRMRHEDDREKARTEFHRLFGRTSISPPVVITADERDVRIGKATLPRLPSKRTYSNILLSSQTTLLEKLATCVEHKWLSLLVGPRNSGKRATIESLAQLTGVSLVTIALNAETDAQELIGSYEQMVDDSALDAAKSVLSDRLLGKVSDAAIKGVRFSEDLLTLETAAEIAFSQLGKNTKSVLDECRDALETATRSVMRFAWVDSSFVKAFVEGHWLLIEDVNLCSAAVLDRLNSCLENDGHLVISERQSSFEPLPAHPNFRVFLSMDARNGDISRAMRNRSVEIYMDSSERWNTCPLDGNSLTSSIGKSISPAVARVVAELPAEKQLHFHVLLKELSVDEACRAIGIEYEEDMEELSYLHAPCVSDVGTERHLQWLAQSWNPQGDSSWDRFFMCVLSASTSLLKSSVVNDVFGSKVKSFLSRVSTVLKKWPTSSHPIDYRFSAGSINKKDVSKYVESAIMEWARSSMEAEQPSEGSAEHLSRTLTKYEMSTSDASFKNMQLIAGFVDATLKTLKEGSLSESESKIFGFCISLLLFVRSARQSLSSRAGCAPIYLAWNDLIGNEHIPKVGPILNKVMTLMRAGWTAEAHDQFVSQYLELYEKHRLVEPFDSEEDNTRFISIAETKRDLDNDEPMETEGSSDDEDNDEGNDMTRKHVSPIAGALQLVDRMHHVMQFLASLTTNENDSVFKSQSIYCALRWRDESIARFARVLSLLNTEYQDDHNVASIPLLGAFSAVYVSFWSSLEFDPNMGLLSVADLREFALNTFIRQLWRLAPNSALLSGRISSELQTVSNGVSGWTKSDGHASNNWRSRVNTAMHMMDLSLPPADTLDPVVFEEELTRYYSLKLDLVSRQLDILSEWRMTISRQKMECDSLSEHPIISSLFSLRDELNTKLENKVLDEDPVYRQKASQYSSLCSEMRSFRSVASEMVARMMTIEEERLSTVDVDSLRLLEAQLHSFTMSVASFKQSSLLKYSSFVDVLMSFIISVDILLCAVLELASIVEAECRRKELHATSAFPFMFKLKAGTSGGESSELLAWCCRDGSPMPLRLKAAVMRRRIVGKVDTLVDLEWTRKQWQKWYEKNIAKAAEKDFVYRNKTEEEKDELDIIEFFSNVEREKEILSAGDLSLLLDALESSGGRRETGNAASVSDRDEADARYSLALTWIRHVLMGVQQYNSNMHHSTIDSDLAMLKWVSNQESAKELVDVYRGASVKEFRRAVDLLDSLSKRTVEIQERWPEVVTLKLILNSIGKFTSAPLTTTHMKMAGMMECVLENCEDWEKLADRANSLRDELAPLRELLVDWKKMEVRSWSQLLVGVEAEARQSAQLVAYPLFDALFKADSHDSLAAIVAMSAEWLHKGTLLDFAARLRSVRSLAEWAEQLGRESVGSKLRSVASHFAQYAPIIEQKLKEAVDPANHDLEDYIKIVKYKDLNLWNIKVSSQKAHSHLYKIIRKFKAAVVFEVEPHFDTLLNIDQYRNVESISLELARTEEEGRVRRAYQLADKIISTESEMCDISALTELVEQTQSCDTALRTMINYDVHTEKEAKEKAQGYARNCRQRDVAMVIKEAQVVGLTARKAVTLNQENITLLSITGIATGGGREGLVRVCSGGRNACIRSSIKANDQLGISTRKHLTGVVEYGMSWMLQLQSRLNGWEKTAHSLKKHGRALDRLSSNFETNWYIDHESMMDRFTSISELAGELQRIVNGMKNRIDMVPEYATDIDSSCSSHMHPLSLLHSGDSRLDGLKQTVAHAVGLADGMARTIENIMKAHFVIFERSSVIMAVDQLGLDAVELEKSLNELTYWFEIESSNAGTALSNIKHKLEVNQVEISSSEVTLDSGLLLVQSLYKSVVDGDEHLKTAKLMERLDATIESIEKCGAEKALCWISTIVSEAAVGIYPSSLSEITSLVHLCGDLLHKSCSIMSAVLQSVGILYHTILSMAMQLFEKGYVNTIPKDGKQESGEGKTDESGEGGGMGEGQSAGDAKDVTDEMEETGQIEGLQDEEQEAPSGKPGDNDKPIEMDEDFAEDIQDIDKNEKGDDDKEDEDNEDEEPEAEDQMGDVEEADETELDPKLWDEEDKDDDRKDTDQDDKGADNETEQLAAKEDDPMATEEQEKGDKEDETDVNEEEETGDDKPEEDLENMDERDRHDEEENHEMEKDEINQPDDADNGDDINMDEELHGDETDNEDEETKEGDGDEDMDTDLPEEEDMDASRNPGEDEETEEKKEDAEAVEQGTGGERRQNDKEDDESGGLNEDEDEEQKKDDDEGQGHSKADDRGDAGKGTETKEKDDAEREEEREGEEREQEDGAEKQRELATDDQEVEEAELGEGEEHETGQKMEDAAVAPRQMMGGGTMEEARQSKKDERKARPQQHKKQPLVGAEEEMDVPAEDGGDHEEAQASIHLGADDMFTMAESLTKELVLGESKDREESANQPSEARQSSMADAERMWTEISQSVNILSAELAENLRLILEPQRASKMQGDYRTGKRLNMRRLIPYIASEYRKDRIWMRRTKRAQREYQVMIAVDDSASMNENGIHQVTCEAVCSIDDALRRCDAGAVSVCSFGTGVETICAFGDQMTPGPELLQKLTFDQSSTDLLCLLNNSRTQLNEVRTPTSEQLLIIISDGRGALSHGAEKVRQALASLQGVTVLFVILDSGKKSISELSVASFKGGSVVLTPYMSLFPFPFYAIVKTVHQLPAILAESIRQWFELTTQSSSF